MKNSEFIVLVVDDSKLVRNVLKNKIESEVGYTVEIAENGLQALEFIQTHEVHFIITDIEMPEIDGLTLLKKMKYLYPLVPIIIISAHSSMDNIEIAFRYFALRFFQKPIDYALLIETLKKAKSEYEEIIADKAALDDISFSLDFKLQKSNFRNNKTIIKKIIKMSSEIFMTNYEKGTEIFIMLTELFLLIKQFAVGLSENNFLRFTYRQTANAIMISVFDSKSEINFEEILQTELQEQYLKISEYFSYVSPENAGKKIVFHKN